MRVVENKGLMNTARTARLAGIKISTIRYYERQGLVQAKTRTPSGYRQFTEQDVRTFKFIKRAQELGFSLAEIRKFLAFSKRRVPQNRDVYAVGKEKLQDLNQRIQDLTRMRAALELLLSNVCDISESAECPVIAALVDTE